MKSRICASCKYILHIIFYRIETPTIDYQGLVCVTFKYHMYGRDIGSLVVYGEQSGMSRNNYIPKA